MMFKTNLKSLSLLFFLTVDWRKLFDSVSLISQYDINVSKLNLQIYIQRKKKKKRETSISLPIHLLPSFYKI